MAISLTKAEVIQLAPELSAETDDAKWTRVIDAALAQVQESALGATIGKLAATYLAAHLMTIARPGSGGLGGGVVSSVTVGPVTTSYATNSSSEDTNQLGSTSYGKEFVRLARTHAPRFFST